MSFANPSLSNNSPTGSITEMAPTSFFSDASFNSETDTFPLDVVFDVHPK